MSEWVDLIDDVPVTKPIDDRHDWYCSEDIYVKDTSGNEAIATYYVKHAEDIEEWWDVEDSVISTHHIRYWKSK